MIFNRMESLHVTLTNNKMRSRIETTLRLSATPAHGIYMYLGDTLKRILEKVTHRNTNNSRIKQFGSAVVGPKNPTKVGTIVSRGEHPLQITGHILGTNKDYEGVLRTVRYSFRRAYLGTRIP